MISCTNVDAYELNCGDCKAAYIRKTFRSFKTRIKEHMYDVCLYKKNSSSHFAKHLKDSNYKLVIDKHFKVLHMDRRNKHLLNSFRMS